MKCARTMRSTRSRKTQMQSPKSNHTSNLSAMRPAVPQIQKISAQRAH